MPLDIKFIRLISIGLKLIELVLAFIYLGVVAYEITSSQSGQTFVGHHTKVTSFVTITAGFVVPTFLLLVVQLHAKSAEKQRHSIFEMLYNVSAVIFHVAASSTLLSYSEQLISGFPGQGAFRAGGIMGLMNTAFYGASAVIAFVDYNTGE